MGALVLSGIAPTDYWSNFPSLPEDSKTSSTLWVDQFNQLIYGLWEEDEEGEKIIVEKSRKHMRGLDGETQATTGSIRFQNARRVLRHWDAKCEDENKYLPELDPVEFLAWLEELCWEEKIHLFDRRWLDACLKLYGLGVSKTILPADVVGSFLKVTDIGDDGGWHPLGTDISEAQREAISRGKDPYAIEVVFPLLIRILDDRRAIDRANVKYVSGKTLPVMLHDGSLYVLKRDSLRVQLGRLRTKYFTPQ